MPSDKAEEPLEEQAAKVDSKPEPRPRKIKTKQ